MTDRKQRPSSHDEGLTKKIAHAAAEKAQEGASLAAENTHVAAHAAQEKAKETAQLTAAGFRDDESVLSVREDNVNTTTRLFYKIFGVYDIYHSASFYTLPVGGDGDDDEYTPRMTLNGTSLLRPQKISGILIVPLVICIVAAVIIGLVLFNNIYSNVLTGDKKATQEISEVLATPAEVQIPSAQSVVGLDDATIAANLTAADSQVYQAKATSNDVSLLLYRIPPAVSIAVAQTEIEKGIANLDAVSAVRLLNGFWELAVSRDSSKTTIAMRYTDFVRSNCAMAITAVMAQQGLAEDSVTDSGVDELGNTYKTGTAVVNGVATTWRVNSVPLTDKYSVKNLPSSACYVVLKYSY